ncbi:MAG: hypothetical protein IT345_14290 [Trueperaceae bacterium]|nr:hypothetical protein [Trueperaceae bacterium]
MSRKRPRWIVIENWDRFQHYRNRDPSWIKNYTALLHDDDYLNLTPPQRALLHGLWMLYAKTHRSVLEDTAMLSSRLGLRVRKDTLESLNRAGFIRFSASRPLADRFQDASPEKEREEKTTSSLSPPNPLSPNVRSRMPAGTAPPTADAAAPRPATGTLRKWQPGDPPL